MQQQQPPPIYDVCGTSFISGCTNFNMWTVLEALRSAGITERRYLYAHLHIVVYDSLWASSQLEFVDNKVMWNAFEVTIDTQATDLGPIVHSTLSDGKKFVTLRTREC